MLLFLQFLWVKYRGVDFVSVVLFRGYKYSNPIITANGCNPVLFLSNCTRKMGLSFKGVAKVRAALVSGEGDVLSFPNGNGVLAEKAGFFNGVVEQQTGIETQPPDAIGFGSLAAEITPTTSGFFADEYDLDRPTEGFASIPEAIEDIRQGKVCFIIVTCLIIFYKEFFG